MRTEIARTLGCEVPIFAFSHCRDVVVEVTRAGGFGVLGAATFGPQQLEQELAWIDGNVAGRPYGVDVLIPSTYDRAAEAEGEAGDPERLIPDRHRDFMEQILTAAGVPPLPDAWEQPGAPAYLPTPLQGILYNETHARIARAGRKDLCSIPAGQAIGGMTEETTVREVMVRLQTEYLDAIERLTKLEPPPTPAA